MFLPGRETSRKCMGCHCCREAPAFAGIQHLADMLLKASTCSMTLQNSFGLSWSMLVVLYTINCNHHGLLKRCFGSIPFPKGSFSGSSDLCSVSFSVLTADVFLGWHSPSFLVSQNCLVNSEAERRCENKWLEENWISEDETEKQNSNKMFLNLYMCFLNR